MLIRVLRFRGRAPDTVTEVEFAATGGTIGRSPECTLMLPDPERHISRIQAEVIWSGRDFLLVERGAANPIEHNGEALATGQSVVLCDGDELHIGDYVLRIEFDQTKTEVRPKQVTMSEEAGATDMKTAIAGSDAQPTKALPGKEATQPGLATRAKAPASGDGGKELPNTAPSATGGEPPPYRLPATHPASAAFRSWDNPEGISQTLIVGKSETRTSREDTEPGAAAAETPPAADAPERIAGLAEQAADARPRDFAAVPKSRTTGFLQELNRKVLDAKPATSRPASKAPAELMLALLSGAGLPDLPHGELDEEAMRRIGALLRIFAQGIIDLLAARAAMKAEMRAEMTLIASAGNNPLKLSPDAATALGHLLAAYTTRSFMAPEEAVQDAVNDMIAHQAAIMSGVRAALQELLQRFSPEAMEKRLSGRSVLDAMLPMNRKAKLWELFEEAFADVAMQAQEDVDALFSSEFVKAYEAQVRRAAARDR